MSQGLLCATTATPLVIQAPVIEPKNSGRASSKLPSVTRVHL